MISPLCCTASSPISGPFGVTVHPASSRPLAFGDFRQHLDSALEPIRSASPLVPELSAATSDSATVDVDAGESHSSLSPNPPTLPPIFPSTLSDDWEQNSPLFSFTPLDEGRTNLPAPELSLPRWIDSSSSSTTHARASPSGWFTHFSYSPEHQAPGDLGPRFSGLCDPFLRFKFYSHHVFTLTRCTAVLIIAHPAAFSDDHPDPVPLRPDAQKIRGQF